MKCSGKPFFSEGGCSKCVRDNQSCSLLTKTNTRSSVPVSLLPPPQVWYDQQYESYGLKPNDLTAYGRYPPSFLAQLNEQVKLPSETAKTFAAPSRLATSRSITDLEKTAKAFAQPSKSTASRSILDLENSDPDFSKRYPPLMSLRKSKTISSLAERSKSPFLTNINPEAEISRFPSLSQIEHRMRNDLHRENLCRNVEASRRPWSFAEHIPQQAALRPKANFPLVEKVPDVMPVMAPKLPGAWPEPRLEAEGPALPTSEESSGAFFDRMTRKRSSELATKTSQYTPAHLRNPLTVDTSCLPRHLRQPRAYDNGGPQLGRSKTVTASNPAARLTKPFDPLEDLRQSRANGLPRRSGTERYRRRPYDDVFTGAGRMPWESFENVPQSDRPAASRPEPRRSKRSDEPSGGNDQISAGFGIPDKVTQCVKQLRDMGYGNRSPHESSRLSIYAAVCGGKVMDAVEMIEEDRKAGLQRQLVGDKLGMRPLNDTNRLRFGS